MRLIALPLTAIALTVGLAACGDSSDPNADDGMTAERTPTTTDMSSADPAGTMDTPGAGDTMGGSAGNPAGTGSGAASDSMGTSGSSGETTTPTDTTIIDRDMPSVNDPGTSGDAGSTPTGQ